MKLAISSPGRSEKFPPPLMRFLRSNVGSKSRGRSRASPMFYLRSRKTSSGAAIETTQEPSSPKVTCIGQVRVRRSSKSKRAGAAVNRRRCRCWWVKKTFYRGKKFPRFRSQKRPFMRCFEKWGSFFRSGYCKKADTAEDSFRVNRKNEKRVNLACSSNVSEREVHNNNNRNKYESLGLVAESMKRNSLDSSSSTSSPPKNALLLTRCRSAPYRSSSLGGRFWGSPLRGRDENDEAESKRKTEELPKLICENVEEEPRISRESSRDGEMEDSGKKDVQDLKGTAGIAGNALHPLLLMRCKSEPARTGERLVNPDANFWRQRRSGAVVEPCSSGHNS